MISKLFPPADTSPVGLVRIAINFDQVSQAQVLSERLKERGYQVGLNMMQSHGKAVHDQEVSREDALAMAQPAD